MDLRLRGVMPSETRASTQRFVRIIGFFTIYGGLLSALGWWHSFVVIIGLAIVLGGM
jgi:hypothetical protein